MYFYLLCLGTSSKKLPSWADFHISLFLLIFVNSSNYLENGDRMLENVKKELDVKESEITSTVKETCFVNIPEDEIKLENTEIQGNFDKFTFSWKIEANFATIFILSVSLDLILRESSVHSI